MTFIRDTVDGKPGPAESSAGATEIYITIENIGTVTK
jgi:hypothetical protein